VCVNYSLTDEWQDAAAIRLAPWWGWSRARAGSDSAGYDAGTALSIPGSPAPVARTGSE